MSQYLSDSNVSEAYWFFALKSLSVMAHTQESLQTFSAVSIMSRIV